MDIFIAIITHDGKMRVYSIPWQDSVYEEMVYIAEEEALSYYQCPKKVIVAVLSEYGLQSMGI